MCGASVCNSCSGSRVRLAQGKDKERVCDDCSAEIRAHHADQLLESVDVRMQMITNLKQLLREKYEKVEGLKSSLVRIIDEQEYLRDAPSLTAPFRFSSETGLSRINFSELVEYLDERIKYLRVKLGQIQHSRIKEESQQIERRRNFGFLRERTDRAEADAARVAELVMQRDRLRETYREQGSRLRAFKDRIELLELQSARQGLEAQGDLPPGVMLEAQFIGDSISATIFPCLD